jgi:hypothetical protein
MAQPGTGASERRMRVRRGRVMHVVEAAPSGWLRSKCRRPHPVRGVRGSVPRAEAPEADWSHERLWYPDCRHCPSGGT